MTQEQIQILKGFWENETLRDTVKQALFEGAKKEAGVKNLKENWVFGFDPGQSDENLASQVRSMMRAIELLEAGWMSMDQFFAKQEERKHIDEAE